MTALDVIIAILAAIGAFVVLICLASVLLMPHYLEEMDEDRL